MTMRLVLCLLFSSLLTSACYSEQLRTYVATVPSYTSPMQRVPHESTASNDSVDGQLDEEQRKIVPPDFVQHETVHPPHVQLATSLDVFPKTLIAGDILYVKQTWKNISSEPLEYPSPDRSRHQNTFLWLGDNALESKFADRLPGGIPNLARQKKVLKPGATVEMFQSFFVPHEKDYDKHVLALNDTGDTEKMMFTFYTSLFTFLSDDSENSRIVSHRARIFQELNIKPRPEEELLFIMDCRKRGLMPFHGNCDHDHPSLAEWREFENKLTPGTLRNQFRMFRTLFEISRYGTNGNKQDQVEELLKWINTLHPLEKEGLTLLVHQIVVTNFMDIFIDILQDSSKGTPREQLDVVMKWISDVNPYDKEELTASTYYGVIAELNKISDQIGFKIDIPVPTQSPKGNQNALDPE